MLQNDSWIKQQGETMISPFIDHQVKEIDGRRVISYGLSSFGYDIRLAEEIQEFDSDTLDPKAGIDVRPASLYWNNRDVYWNNRDVYYLMPPHATVLSRSYEYIKVPDNVQVQVLGKSTWARVGLLVNCTPLEPGWEGYITMEISNLTHSYIRLYLMEGIAQLIFHVGETPQVTYASRNGKYQKQLELTLPKV